MMTSLILRNALLAGLSVATTLTATGCGKNESGPKTAAVDAAQAKVDPSAEFLAMTDLHAGLVLREAPEFATSLGVSEEIGGAGYNARLGSYGFASNHRARELNEQFLQELAGHDRKLLTGTAAATFDVLKNAYEMGARRNQFEFGGAAPYGSSSPYLVTQLSGPHLFLPRMLQTQHPISSNENIEGYLFRLAEFGRVFDEVVETIGADAAIDVVPPHFALTGAVNSIRGFISLPAASHPLTTTLSAKMGAVSGLSAGERADYARRAADLVETVVYPAYSRLAAALEEMIPAAGEDAGIWRLGEEGERFYLLALQSYGAGGMDGEDIHQLGLEEVARITNEMDAILKAQGMSEGTMSDRFAKLADRPGQVYPNTDEGRDALLADLNDQVEAIMALAPTFFATLPKQAVEVRRIPVYEQDSAPGGYYSGPSLDGARPGIYWINLKDTADWPKHTLKTLTYHEAVPGHHFQISLQRSIVDMPLIRNMLGYSEFSEGWALYAEQVAAEMGMYKDDPLGDLGRLQSELFRAARLVVDSGLHHKRWTREEAIEYMVAATGETVPSVTREIERYSVWPGQACAYKLGMIRIAALRRKAETELGSKFDIRQFHDAILLDGSMPLPVLERKVERWIAEQKQA